MANLKNMDKRLITINHGGKRYDIKCGDNPAVEVPDEALGTDFVKNLINTGKLVSTGAVVTDTTTDEDDNAEMRAELKEMTVAELKEHCKLLDLNGYSRMKEDELIDFIIANS